MSILTNPHCVFAILNAMKRELSKSRQPLVRATVYSVMTVSVIVIVTLLMFVVLGYQFNERDGRIEQGGLLQFASVPTGATVTLDDSRLGPQTNSKANVTVGSHSVSFDRNGYRTWKKTITIGAGQIGWLSYARLIPSTIEPVDIRTFTDLNSALASPQQNYMLLHEAADQPSFVLANIQGDTVRYDMLTLPAGSYTPPSAGKTQSFILDSWSENEAAVLIKHVYDDNKEEWLLLDRDAPDRSLNVSSIFAIQPSKIVFAGKGDRLLFAQTDDIVRRINLDEQTLSRPLASKVTYFTGYDDKTIAYVATANSNQQRTVGYAAVDVSDPIVLGTYPDDGQPLYATMSTYFSKRFVVILHGQTLTVKAGTLPTKSDKGSLKHTTTVKVPAGATDLSLEHNSRFAVMRLPDGYATYDIELNKFDSTIWAAQSTAVRSLQWLDQYILWSDHGGQLRLYEFDGANQQNIMPVTEGFAVSVSPNDKYIYGVLKTDKGFEFQRAQLILDN